MTRELHEHAREVDAAIEQALAGRRLRPTVPDGSLIGRVLTEDVVVAVDVPRFTNSQMDGFALRAADLPSGPVTLPTTAHIRAGMELPPALLPGHAAPIMTGAPLPAGADTIVPIEDTAGRDFGPAGGGGEVTVTGPVTQGQFVRPVGADIAIGEVMFARGSTVTPAMLGAIALGAAAVPPTSAALSILVLSTGDELVNGQIDDANGITLASSLDEFALAATRRQVGDDPAALVALLDQVVASVDLVITTGGVSKGAYEVVRHVLGGRAGSWFGHVAMKPGGPQGLSSWEDGGRQVPVVCLPGNPVSVAVSFEALLRPSLVERIRPELGQRPRGTAPLLAPLRSAAGKLELRRGRIDADGNAVVVGGPGSHLMVSLALSTHLIAIPPDTTDLAAGDTVEWWRIA